MFLPLSGCVLPNLRKLRTNERLHAIPNRRVALYFGVLFDEDAVVPWIVFAL